MNRLLHVLMCLLLTAGIARATTFRGHVYDRQSGEPLPGATVSLSGKTVLTGLDGSFELKGLKKGTYTLRISYVMYQSYEKEQNIREEGTPPVKIYLVASGRSLDEVTIVSKDDGASERMARRLELQSVPVMNVVSGRAIEVSPDLTVANVIQRVSGVSVERNSNGDAQHAILRGMDKRYNYTLVNGVKIPSPDNQYRYVPLDIFPSDLLDRLEVTKTLTPDMEGDAVGGVVNMVMKDAPDRLQVNANIAGGYNQLFFDRKFMSYDYSSISKKSPYEVYGSTYQATAADFPKGVMDYRYKRPDPNLVGSLSIGQRFFKNRLGLIIAGSYQNTYRGNDGSFYNSAISGVDEFSTITSKDARQYSEQQKRYGLHGKVDYAFNDRNKLSLYTVYADLDNIQVRDVINTDYSSEYDPARGNAKLNYTTRSRFTRQEIYNSTLHGEHLLAGDRLKVKWSGVYSSARNSVPDNTLVYLYGVEQNGISTRTYVDNLNKNTQRWERNTDEDKAGYLDLTYTLKSGKRKLDLSAGGMYRDKERSNFYNSYSLNPVNASAMYGTDFLSYTDIAWSVQNPAGGVRNALTYSASEKTGAGYGMLTYRSPAFEATGGARVEHTEQGYNLLFPAGESSPEGKQVYTEVLPSVTLKYHLNSTRQLHASYFRSLNRPGFSEIVPTKWLVEDYWERGNPALKHAVADNFDLRYELFPDPAEQLLAGVFYKKISNPIEFILQTDNTRGQDVYYNPGNFGTARNFGAEADYSRYFSRIGFRINYTYTHSSITTSKIKRVLNSEGRQESIPVQQKRPLLGQSEHIGNASLLYKDPRKGWNGQLAAAYTGERIVLVSQYINNDLWQAGFVQMDASLEKEVDRRFTVFAKAGNLLNTPVKQFIKGTNPSNEGIAGAQEYDGKTLIRKEHYGQSYLLGLRYKFD